MKPLPCRCRFGSLGPASFAFCQRCGCRHDGGDGAAGIREDKHRNRVAKAAQKGRKKT